MGNFSTSHMFNAGFAQAYGLIESIILNNIIFWIKKNIANEKNFNDGYYWTYNSIKAFKELLPYLSEHQIRNALKSLEEQGVIMTGNYNKLAYDRTLWYTIIDKSILHICQMEVQKIPNANIKNRKPIPDIKPSVNTINNTEDKELTPTKQSTTTTTTPIPKLGTYSNVILTTVDIDNLYKDYPKTIVDNKINDLSDYIATNKKGGNYKNHYLVLKKWLAKDVPKVKSVESKTRIF
jgi:hypothetical protein